MVAESGSVELVLSTSMGRLSEVVRSGSVKSALRRLQPSKVWARDIYTRFSAPGFESRSLSAVIASRVKLCPVPRC